MRMKTGFSPEATLTVVANDFPVSRTSSKAAVPVTWQPALAQRAVKTACTLSGVSGVVTTGAGGGTLSVQPARSRHRASPLGPSSARDDGMTRIRPPERHVREPGRLGEC